MAGGQHPQPVPDETSGGDVKKFRNWMADLYEAKAEIWRETADNIRIFHDQHVNEGNAPMQEAFDAQVEAIDKALRYEAKAEWWRP